MTYLVTGMRENSVKIVPRDQAHTIVVVVVVVVVVHCLYS
jgi:hypothetical protein